MAKAVSPNGNAGAAVPGVEVINLLKGQPSSELLSLDFITSACSSLFAPSNPDRTKLLLEALQYGPDPGSDSFRSVLAQFLSAAYGESNIRASNLFVSGGVSQAIDLVSQVLSTAGQFVYVEEPTYYLARQIFVDRGLKVVPVPLNSDGIDITLLTQAIEKNAKSQSAAPVAASAGAIAPYSGLIYTICDHHNPTGVHTSADRKRQLIRLARECNLLIVADEVYHLLSFPTSAAPADTKTAIAAAAAPTAIASEPLTPPAIKSIAFYDHELMTAPLSTAAASDGKSAATTLRAHAVGLGSLSKIVAPGLRIGWVQCADEGIIKALSERGWVVSGGGNSQFVCTALTPAISDGRLASNIARIRRRLYERCTQLCNALTEADTGKLLTFTVPAGGYFVWISAPAAMNVSHFHDVAPALGVRALPGAWCSASGDNFRTCFRVSFAFVESMHDLTRGAQRIVAAVKASLSAK